MLTQLLNTRYARSKGLSLVELLVVISIVLALLGLLVPAVQSARESARRIQCSNNVKQFGLAIHSYASVLNSFPPGRLVVVSPSDTHAPSANSNATTGNGTCFSAFAFLLPQLELATVFNQVNFSFGPDTAANNDMSIQQPSVFLCPSDTSIRALPQGSGFVGVSNYALNTGATLAVSPKNPRGIAVNGVFFENSRIRFADIIDGTSHTVCISEQTLSDPSDKANNNGLWNGLFPTSGFILTTGNNNVNNGPELVNYPQDCITGNRFQLTRGNRLLYGAPGHTMYNHLRTPNDIHVDCRGGLPHSQRNFYWWSRLSHNTAARSRHAHGVYALFCDGHVQFITANIDGQIWSRLGNRHDGEVVHDF